MRSAPFGNEIAQKSVSVFMRLTESRLCFVFLAICSASVAQTGNYFPLETGNAWMYRLAGAGSNTAFRTISVEGRETIRGFDYSRVRYFERTVYLRATPDGSIVSFNRATGSDELWLKLNDPVGSTFESGIDECTNTGQIEDRGAEVVTPAGRFTDTVRIGFRGNCADAGLTYQIYSEGVGPVVHEETSFIGPRRYELVYFRTGAAEGTEISFTIGLDAPRYQPGGNLAVRLTLRSTHPDAVKLHFPSGQSFDLKIYDEGGTPVYTWSADKLFIQMIRDEQFGPGERTYGFQVRLGTLRPGRYKAQGFLTTSPQMYLAETSFEIVP